MLLLSKKRETEWFYPQLSTQFLSSIPSDDQLDPNGAPTVLWDDVQQYGVHACVCLRMHVCVLN